VGFKFQTTIVINLVGNCRLLELYSGTFHYAEICQKVAPKQVATDSSKLHIAKWVMNFAHTLCFEAI
jgi:hypothetical protein